MQFVCYCDSRCNAVVRTNIEIIVYRSTFWVQTVHLKIGMVWFEEVNVEMSSLNCIDLTAAIQTFCILIK